MTIRVVTVGEGKYSVLFDENTGELRALRHGEAWDRNLSGDKLVLCLMQEIEFLRSGLNEALDMVAGLQCKDNSCDPPIDISDLRTLANKDI